MSAIAQTANIIATGRPGQSIGQNVVGENIFQIQSGVEFSEVSNNESDNNIYLNNIFRYGLSEQWELSSVIDYDNSSDSDSNLGNFQVGGRVNLISEVDGIVPALGFQTRLQFYDKMGERNKNILVTSILSSGWSLGRFGSITSNLNFNNANEVANLFGYTVSWSKDISDGFNYFLEYYSTRVSSDFYDFFDTGLRYTVHKDLALDLAVGKDLEKEYDSSFIALGFSWRTL